MVLLSGTLIMQNVLQSPVWSVCASDIYQRTDVLIVTFLDESVAAEEPSEINLSAVSMQSQTFVLLRLLQEFRICHMFSA